ncbi:MAG: N-acetylmuramoyl-L-alanine amidase [Alphaproteobacteria bacterium]
MRVSERPSPNHGPRPADTPVDMLVLHYTGMATAEAALARLRDPTARVSAHWLVDEAGGLVRLVDEARAAWHAGVSAWAGHVGLNGRSIGVEIVNGGHDFGLPPYPDAQIAAVIALAREVGARWSIPAVNVVAHSDVAPMRKADPGERFPWARLAHAGVGLWPEPADGPPAASVTGALAAIGYMLDGAPQPTTVTAALKAFQRRFGAGGPIDGRPDAATRRRLGEVAACHLLARAAHAP